jgi:hypothetical protein
MEHFNAYIGALHKHLDVTREESRAKQAEEAAAKSYAVRDTIYMRVHRKVHPRTGETSYYGYAIAGLPDPSMRVELHMPDLSDLLHETRFVFAEALFKARVEPTWDAAKKRAANSQPELAELVTE